MACGKSSCQSGGCHKYDEEVDDQKPLTTTRGSINGNLCVKCKASPAVAGGAGGGDDGRFCAECFRGSLFGKFRLAVTSNGMISPSDKVLVAFSGGPSSRVALQFMHEMQDKALKNFEASRDKSLPVFGVGVAFINEHSALSIPHEDADEVVLHIKTIVSDLAPPAKELHVTPIESLYSSHLTDGSSKLMELLDAVPDDTGKEDLLAYLRMLCLQKVAIENGYSKLVLGSCTSTIARHVISATVKGQGYSLPADIQYVDARWKVPALLPLRDCLAQELNVLCQLDGLKTLVASDGPRSGINALVSSFISLLQEENPSRECTIVRTGGKLTPFSFNRLPDVDDPKARLASQRRQKKFNIKSDDATPPESFCSLCSSPLHKSDSTRFISHTNEQQSADVFEASFCSSCRFQILPVDSSSMEYFYSLLPQPMIAGSKINSYHNRRLLREQIQDFLLSDGED
uniref:Cytoplasmic tRNA 2-thiolation protein 2 n=1 Tax=Opuntia streptacantha TaxID=393608 RepID=A0A7C9EQS3_OPUST